MRVMEKASVETDLLGKEAQRRERQDSAWRTREVTRRGDGQGWERGREQKRGRPSG